MPLAPLPDELVEFLKRPHAAVISTVRSDGAPYSAATWYDWEDGRVLLNLDESRRRLEYLRGDPRVAVTAMQEDAWYKQVSVMGEVVSVEPDRDLRDIDRLAVRYTGSPFARRDQPRWSVWVRVDRWFGWNGGAAWPPERAYRPE
mgnify:CR=1 FL=1